MIASRTLCDFISFASYIASKLVILHGNSEISNRKWKRFEYLQPSRPFVFHFNIETLWFLEERLVTRTNTWKSCIRHTCVVSGLGLMNHSTCCFYMCRFRYFQTMVNMMKPMASHNVYLCRRSVEQNFVLPGAFFVASLDGIC